MKVIIPLLSVLVIWPSFSMASSPAYYPWERESKLDTRPIVYCTVGNCFMAANTANHIQKLDKLSKKPLLSKTDIRGLRTRRVLMPIAGVIEVLYGVVAIGCANKYSHDSSTSLTCFAFSATALVNAGLCFVDARKSHQVLSRYKREKENQTSR